jgi:hypothetical protein
MTDFVNSLFRNMGRGRAKIYTVSYLLSCRLQPPALSLADCIQHHLPTYEPQQSSVQPTWGSLTCGTGCCITPFCDSQRCTRHLWHCIWSAFAQYGGPPSWWVDTVAESVYLHHIFNLSLIKYLVECWYWDTGSNRCLWTEALWWLCFHTSNFRLVQSFTLIESAVHTATPCWGFGLGCSSRTV